MSLVCYNRLLQPSFFLLLLLHHYVIIIIIIIIVQSFDWLAAFHLELLQAILFIAV